MKKFLFLVILLWGAAPTESGTGTIPARCSVSYRTVAIKRGDVGSTINTTGTIEPEEVVDAGAQVAGPDRELRPRPLRPQKDDQLRVAGRTGDCAGPARQRAVSGETRPGARPRRQGRSRHRAGRGQAPSDGPRARTVQEAQIPRGGRHRRPGI